MSLKQFILRVCAMVALLVTPWAQASTAAFMTIADIHFDPFTTCQSTPCPLINKLEKAPAALWHAILAAETPTMPRYRQDTNYTLLQSALQAFQNTAQSSHPQFILVLGDLLGHRYQNKYQKFALDKTSQGYQDFVKKTMTFLAGEFNNKFATTDVYITVGNNDSYLGDNISEPDSAFFHDMGELWGQQILNKTNRVQMQQNFSTAGYYALDIPQQPSLRLLVLNSNLFSPYAKVPSAVVTKEFEWFEAQLKQARAQNQHVLIAMHIPAGIDAFASIKSIPFKIIEMWRPDYTERYANALMEYSDIISGVLSGHIHSDYFQVITANTSAKVPVSGTPSISHINGNNPGFKVFNYDTKTLSLQDYTTFYTPVATLSWGQEYNFNTVYAAGKTASTLVNGIEQVNATGKLAHAYQLYYDTNSNSDPVHYSFNPYYWCQLKNLTAAEYQTCMSLR